MRIIMKRTLSILIALVMVLSMGDVNFASAASKPAKKAWSSTMVVGDTATFSISNAKGYTVAWASSKITVATVDKKTGLVAAIKAGTTEITATLAKGKTTVKLSGKVKISAARSNVVKTESGKVKGIQNGKDINWYSIPYAAEPVGKLRWNEPKDPASWSSALDCKKRNYDTTLSLDVTTSNKSSSNLPVFVFFHGGGNRSGSSNEITGNDMVVYDDCVVVSVNYRLGLMGFNCLPALQTEEGSTGNYALLDMQKSLLWVKENIKNFGGDPDNITISGHSAGGRDVMAMLISPVFKGLFQKAVVSSGGMTTCDVDKAASQIAYYLAPCAVKDGKAATVKEAQKWLLTSGSDVKEYLYSLSPEKLYALGSAGITMSAFPHLFTDGVTLPKEGFNTTVYNDVPVIMITGTDEFSTFNNGTAYTDGSIAKKELDAAKTFGRTYGSMMYGYFNTTASAGQMVANGYQSPIYLMDFNFAHDATVWPELSSMGSYHGIVWRFIEKNGVSNTNGEKELSTLTHQYLKNFMWNTEGNPNSSEKTDWTAYTADSPKWFVLDATRETASATMTEPEYTSYESIFKLMDADKTISASAKSAVIKTVLIGRWFSDALDSTYKNPNLWY